LQGDPADRLGAVEGEDHGLFPGLPGDPAAPARTPPVVEGMVDRMIGVLGGHQHGGDGGDVDGVRGGDGRRRGRLDDLLAEHAVLPRPRPRSCDWEAPERLWSLVRSCRFLRPRRSRLIVAHFSRRVTLDKLKGLFPGRTVMATKTNGQSKSAFVRDFIGKNPTANRKAVEGAWRKAGHEGPISSALVSN